jgi:DNA-binding MarR family transcriptional regulator
VNGAQGVPPSGPSGVGARGAVDRLRLGERLHVLAAGAERVVEDVARRRRMRATEVHALVAVAAAEHAGASPTPGDLAQSLRLTTGAITGLVDRLVSSGHVVREPDGLDRRRVRIVCREPGLEVAGELWSALAGRADGAVADLTPGELAVVDRFLEGIVDATEGSVADPELEDPSA